MSLCYSAGGARRGVRGYEGEPSARVSREYATISRVVLTPGNAVERGQSGSQVRAIQEPPPVTPIVPAAEP